MSFVLTASWVLHSTNWIVSLHLHSSSVFFPFFWQEPDTFAFAYKNIGTPLGGGQLRYNYYPKVDISKVKPGQIRCGEHTDYGGITLLIQDDVGGLEVWENNLPPITILLPQSWGKGLSFQRFNVWTLLLFSCLIVLFWHFTLIIVIIKLLDVWIVIFRRPCYLEMAFVVGVFLLDQVDMYFEIKKM